MEVRRYVDYHRQQIRLRDSSRAQLATEVRERLPRLAQALTALGARRIVLFGSLATGTFDEYSDVDLAIEGLPAGSLVDAISVAGEILRRPVDVVRIEKASPRLTARIEADGEIIHE